MLAMSTLLTRDLYQWVEGGRKAMWLSRGAPIPPELAHINRQCFQKETLMSERLNTLAFGCTFQGSGVTVGLYVFPDTVSPHHQIPRCQVPFQSKGPALFQEAVPSNKTNSLLIPRPTKFFSGCVLAGVPSAMGTANH